MASAAVLDAAPGTFSAPTWAGRALFLVWGTPDLGPRSQALARALGIDDLHFVCAGRRRGLLSAPFRYACQALTTVRLLCRRHPKLVFVQSPPNLAVLCTALYCRLTRGRYVVDAHSAAFLSPWWTKPARLNAALARRAITTIVTNEQFGRVVAGWGGDAFVLHDVPIVPAAPPAASRTPTGQFVVTLVGTFSDDEPLAEVLAAADRLPDVRFCVTGRKALADPAIFAAAPRNVHFTDFLPNDEYFALLQASDAVMCLTTRDHTMQRGAVEALALGRPIITSDWPLLRSYFHAGTVHVPNTGDGIAQGVRCARERHAALEVEIAGLQVAALAELRRDLEALSAVIEEHGGASAP